MVFFYFKMNLGNYAKSKRFTLFIWHSSSWTPWYGIDLEPRQVKKYNNTKRK